MSRKTVNSASFVHLVDSSQIGNILPYVDWNRIKDQWDCSVLHEPQILWPEERNIALVGNADGDNLLVKHLFAP